MLDKMYLQSHSSGSNCKFKMIKSSLFVASKKHVSKQLLSPTNSQTASIFIRWNGVEIVRFKLGNSK